MIQRLRSIPLRDLAAVALLALSLLAMLGDAIRVRALKGIALATAASPLPKVFSDVDGHETFAADFSLLLDDGDDTSGSGRRVPITPELYNQLTGPYNRRNVYGAALAYAPRLPESLWHPPYCYGLGPRGALRSELGVAPGAGRVRVEIVTRTHGRDDRWVLEPQCPR